MAVLTTFEAAQTIFAWLHEAPWKIGYSLVSFSEMMNAIRLTADIEALSFEAQLGPATNHSTSLAPTWQISLAREAFNAVFFVTTIIMLMNVRPTFIKNGGDHSFGSRFRPLRNRSPAFWCHFLESWLQDGENREKTRKNGAKMGEIWPNKKSAGRRPIVDG